MKDSLLEERAKRFWKFVSIKPGNDCWEWKGGKMRDGYGAFPIRHLRIYSAHRASYAINGGRLMPGMFICHSCDNPGCVNPAHLTQGTPRENSLDSLAKGRWHRPVGELSSRSKLSGRDVIEMRKLYANGVSQRELMAKYKTCSSNVSMILSRKTWTHV